MEQYIDKADVVAQANIEITNLRIAEKEGFLTEYGRGMLEGLEGIVDFLNTLEVKELEEKAVNNDLEDYAKKESESFAEREYEMDYIDRNALAKGYYWGVKAGVQWQKQKNAIEAKEVDISSYVNYFWDSCVKHKNERGGNVVWSNKIEITALANYFYELGLKAQKGE